MECVGNPNRYPTVVRSACAAILLFAASLLTSCNSATIGSADTAEIDVLDKVRSLDILPRQPQQMGGGQPSSGQRSRAAGYDGTEGTEIPETRPQPPGRGGGWAQ